MLYINDTLLEYSWFNGIVEIMGPNIILVGADHKFTSGKSNANIFTFKFM